MVTNKKLGNTFEAELCEMLFEHGFWAHNMAQKVEGQPADVIAAKNKTAYLIDCKVCSDNKFPLSRVEENQHNSMDLWRDSRNGEGWFAFKLNDDEIVMIPHICIKALMLEKSVLNLSDMREYGIKLERWLSKCK